MLYQDNSWEKGEGREFGPKQSQPKFSITFIRIITNAWCEDTMINMI